MKSEMLDKTIQAIEPQDAEWREKAKQRLDQLTMPHWALGRLMDLAMDLAGMCRSGTPPVARKAIVTMAGDHGVAAEGVSAYPQEVTGQMVANFVHGGAGINALAKLAGAKNVTLSAIIRKIAIRRMGGLLWLVLLECRIRIAYRAAHVKREASQST